MNYDVAILGAGAAGMLCAIEAAKRGRRTLVIDHSKRAGEKIRISGGGRCNFTNLYIAPEKFLSENPHFALSALNRFTQWDVIELLDSAGIAWHEKTLGQLFCDGSATQIITLLLDHMRHAGAELWLETSIRGVEKLETGYRVATSRGSVDCSSLVIATGGKSIPKMGATGLGYEIARQFDIAVTPTRAALVPLTFSPHLLKDSATLSGVSVAANVRHGGVSFSEGLLFTHRGLSGPSILQISSYWREGESITVDLHSDGAIDRLMHKDRQSHGRLSIKNALSRHLPERLAARICEQADVSGNLADQSNKALARIAGAVHNWQVTPSGSEGYRTAEVTLGGIDTDQLDARRMEVRAHPGVFFIGEVVDVTGWLGGYNFQWAWSSGWAAGQVC